MPQTLLLHIPDEHGAPLAVSVVRKRVKNLNLRVRPDGSVTLSIPMSADIENARRMLERRRTWILDRRARQRLRTPQAPIPLDGPSAGTLPVWGELAAATGALGLSGHDCAQMGPDELSRRIDALYRREVARALPAVAARLEARMGVYASRWSIRTMKSRWGSCTPRTGAIRINAALAAYPPACLEFVVTHELVHLMEASHDRRFHTLLDIYCPRNRELARLLKLPAREVAANAG